MFRRARFILLVGVCALAAPLALASQQKIYWGDEVPPGWAGKWPADAQTVAERTNFTRTMTSLDNLEFITALRGKSESLHVVNMFVSPMRKAAPAMVVASPRVTTPQQARASGKAVLFLFGNIHPPEPEAAEALQMVARDLAIGSRKGLLENLIVIIAPMFNVDGTDTLVPQDGSLGSETPHFSGRARTRAGFDLNRDAVKLETVEANGLYRLLERMGSRVAARRPPDEPRQPRLREHVWDDYRARGRARSARLHARHAVSGGARDRCARNSASRCSRTPCSAAAALAADDVEPRCGRLDRRSQVHRQRLRSEESPGDHHRKRRASRRSSAGSSRSTRTSRRCSSTRTRTPKK